MGGEPDGKLLQVPPEQTAGFLQFVSRDESSLELFQYLSKESSCRTQAPRAYAAKS